MPPSVRLRGYGWILPIWQSRSVSSAFRLFQQTEQMKKNIKIIHVMLHPNSWWPNWWNWWAFCFFLCFMQMQTFSFQHQRQHPTWDVSYLLTKTYQAQMLLYNIFYTLHYGPDRSWAVVAREVGSCIPQRAIVRYHDMSVVCLCTNTHKTHTYL